LAWRREVKRHSHDSWSETILETVTVLYIELILCNNNIDEEMSNILVRRKAPVAIDHLRTKRYREVVTGFEKLILVVCS